MNGNRGFIILKVCNLMLIADWEHNDFNRFYPPRHPIYVYIYVMCQIVEIHVDQTMSYFFLMIVGR